MQQNVAFPAKIFIFFFGGGCLTRDPSTPSAFWYPCLKRTPLAKSWIRHCYCVHRPTQPPTLRGTAN